MIDTTWLDRAEVARWLGATGDAQQELFRRARAVRDEHCGSHVVLRGLVEVSNYCQKKCDYCALRAPNAKLDRYRLSPVEILDAVAEIKHHDLDIAFLQSGQDPHYDEILEEVIPVIRHEIGLPVLLCVGERPKQVYERFAELGADAYILKFEISDPKLYREVIHAAVERRVNCLRWVKEAGMKLGTGNIVGLPGQTLDHVVDDIYFGASLAPDFISCAPFIPNEDSPFEKGADGSVDLALNAMAVWRVLLGGPLIPAISALELLRPGGQLQGLNAGANVITINFTPEQRRGQYAIYSKNRFVVGLEHARETIERAGLTHESGAKTAQAVCASALT